MRSFYPALFILSTGLLVSAFAQDGAKPAAKPSAATGPGQGNSVIDENPVTVKTPNDVGAKKPVDNDPLFGVPPLPQGKTSLIGGKVAGIDGVHNKLSVHIFGGGKWTVAFDERTHFYRDGAETTFERVKKGERVYVDTMLDNHRIFARNVRVVTKTGTSEARGQVTAVDNGMITVQDNLSAREVQFSVDGETKVTREGTSARGGDIRPGSLIAVQFAPDKENRGVAREIAIVAAPGQTVTFAGKVMHLDLRNNQLAVENNTDNKTYEIAIDRKETLPSNLMVGSDVTVAAVFDGRQYKANSISVK